jgi:hypothetical protein
MYNTGSFGIDGTGCVVALDSRPQYPNLWRWNPVTGAWQVVMYNTGSMGIDGAGGIVALDSRPQYPNLWRWNPVTGAWQVVMANTGSFGIDGAGGIVALDSRTQDPNLWRWNPTTGTWQVVMANTGSFRIDGAGGIVALDSRPDQPNLWRWNPASGAWQVIMANTGSFGIDSAGCIVALDSRSQYPNLWRWDADGVSATLIDVNVKAFHVLKGPVPFYCDYLPDPTPGPQPYAKPSQGYVGYEFTGQVNVWRTAYRQSGPTTEARAFSIDWAIPWAAGDGHTEEVQKYGLQQLLAYAQQYASLTLGTVDNPTGQATYHAPPPPSTPAASPAPKASDFVWWLTDHNPPSSPFNSGTTDTKLVNLHSTRSITVTVKVVHYDEHGLQASEEFAEYTLAPGETRLINRSFGLWPDLVYVVAAHFA